MVVIVVMVMVVMMERLWWRMYAMKWCLVALKSYFYIRDMAYLNKYIVMAIIIAMIIIVLVVFMI